MFVTLVIIIFWLINLLCDMYMQDSIKDGYSLELQTAPISDGVLPGVVREVIIE